MSTTTSSRRTFLGAGGALAGAFALSSIAAGASAAPSGTARTPYRVITPGSEQYEDLLQGTNLRWRGAAQRIAFPTTTDEVAQELRTVLGLGLRPSARSGGHCYEGFVANGDVKAIIDLSAMDQVHWDPEMKAFEVGAGAQLGLVYQLLYKQWGVYAPAGNCPTVGAGGHIAGGGYGSMNRRDGLVVDHLVRWSENGAKFFVHGQVVMTGPQRSYEQQQMSPATGFGPRYGPRASIHGAGTEPGPVRPAPLPGPPIVRSLGARP